MISKAVLCLFFGRGGSNVFCRGSGFVEWF